MQLPIDGANVMVRKAGSAHICVNTPDFEAQIQIITKAISRERHWVCDSRRRDHKLQLNSSIDQFILMATPQSEYCKDQRR